MLKSLGKAVVGLAVDVPASVVADVVTLGGVTTERQRPYTADALARIKENIERAAESDEDDDR